MPYCTAAEATTAGATGTTTQVEAATAEATERIDRFTGERFEPTALTVVAELGHDGVAPLPRRADAVTAVRYVGATTDLPATAYRLRKGSTPGDADALELVTWGADVTVAGAEPWEGGWANLARAGRRIQVTGSFGYAAVPATVRRACARLAAHLTQQPAVGSDDTEGVKSLSVEGYSVTYADTPGSAGEATTGYGDIDKLLAPYRRTKVMVG